MPPEDVTPNDPEAPRPTSGAHAAPADKRVPGSPDAATGPQDPADPPSGDDRAADALGRLERERNELKDQLLRRAADFDNYRKRVERERREIAELGLQDVLLGLLPIIDDFERAISAEIPAEAHGYRAGIELIYKQLQDFLRKHGATPIDAVGSDFDPHLHEAVVHEASQTHRDGEVMAEFQRGYRLGDRLLRAAMVKVAKREQA